MEKKLSPKILFSDYPKSAMVDNEPKDMLENLYNTVIGNWSSKNVLKRS